MDRRLLVLDVRFALDHRAVGQLGVEPDVLERGGQHPAADVEDVGRFDHRPLEAAGDFGQGGDEQIPEGVAVELGPGLAEPVLEESRDEGFVVGQRDETVADVPWRGNVVGGADLAGAPPVIGHGDDRGDRDVVPLQTAQQSREPGPAADGDDVDLGPAQSEAMLGDDLHQLLVRLAVGQHRQDQLPAEAIEARRPSMRSRRRRR